MCPSQRGAGSQGSQPRVSVSPGRPLAPRQASFQGGDSCRGRRREEPGRWGRRRPQASGLAGSGRVLRRQTARPAEPEPGGGRETRGLAPLLALIPNPCQVVAWPWVRCRSSPPSGGWRESQGLRSGRLRPGPGAPSQAGVLRVPHPANSPRRSGHRGRDGEGVERPALRGV